MLAQPDDVSCGPTSLQAVYQYYGINIELSELIKSVDYLPNGGTLAVMLGIDALKRGFDAIIYSYNLKMFDPSWYEADNSSLYELLEKQLKFKSGKRFTKSTRAYQTFLQMGGEIRFKELSQSLLNIYFEREIPILTGLSSTYLYQSRREYTNRKNISLSDDLKGEPTGHFVVLCGMEKDSVFVADPFRENPISRENYYKVGINRLFHSILLGIVTYDANLLIIVPK